MSNESSPPRIGLGVSGGIAAYKAVEILRGLQRDGCEVRVAMTTRACEFVTPLTFRAISGSHVVVDDFAADNPDPIAHITFAQSIDLLLIAPATANLLAKLAHGIADDFLTSAYLAATAPVLVAPAMNTAMWEHPATRRNIEQLRQDGVHFVEPDAGEMACGTFGPGRLSDPAIVVNAALELIRGGAGSRGDLAGEKILITAGATREEIDPVRFLSNHSSGKMGFALAEAARARGAEVTVVAGVTTVEPPSGVRVVRAISAAAMLDAVTREAPAATVFIGAAAVADYRPAQRAETKVKKSSDRLSLTLEPTVDILASVAAARTPNQLVVGFAAETERVMEHAREKLERKNLDLIAANDITLDGAGFDASTNIVTVLRRGSSEPVALEQMSKLAVAHRILDEVVAMRTANGMTAGSAGT
jgi:phosphopantothenoylcysteine decarboxylase/phosphopantothenate--cysteine ligase